MFAYTALKAFDAASMLAARRDQDAGRRGEAGLVRVFLLIVGGLGYAVYRRPALTQPIAVALTDAAFLVAVVAAITSR